MDPLSISAGIIAVLQVTTTILSICYNYRAAINNAPGELCQVTEEIKGLRNILETLQDLAFEAKGTDPAARARLPSLNRLSDPDGPLTSCLAELRQLKRQLAPPKWSGPEGSRRQAVVQSLRWPLRQEDTRKTLESIGRFKSTLNLALLADQA